MKHLKEEFDKLTLKDLIIYGLAVAVMIAAFTLLFLGMFIPPEGEIHDSVLTAYGLALMFVAACMGVAAFGAHSMEKIKIALPAMIAEAIRAKDEEAER